MFAQIAQFTTCQRLRKKKIALTILRNNTCSKEAGLHSLSSPLFLETYSKSFEKIHFCLVLKKKCGTARLAFDLGNENTRCKRRKPAEKCSTISRTSISLHILHIFCVCICCLSCIHNELSFHCYFGYVVYFSCIQSYPAVFNTLMLTKRQGRAHARDIVLGSVTFISIHSFQVFLRDYTNVKMIKSFSSTITRNPNVHDDSGDVFQGWRNRGHAEQCITTFASGFLDLLGWGFD